MSIIKNIQKYSHCILGQYTLRPPTEKEASQNAAGCLDADQYYEHSGTGGATPFRFIAELKMTQNGQQLFDAYYTALKTVCMKILQEVENFVRKHNVDTAKEVQKFDTVTSPLGVRIRVLIRRDSPDKIDTEVLFFIDGDEKGETDFEVVCKKAGIVPVTKLAECLSTPLNQADQSIKANM